MGMQKQKKKNPLLKALLEFRLPLRLRKNPFNLLTILYNLLYYKYPYMFFSIEIDIYNVCNRRNCPYCPNSIYKVNPHKMDEELFYKIIDELATMRYNGRILLHRYGEPLLDERLDKFVRYIKSKCQRARIEIFTNGDFLDYPRFRELVEAGVDYFEITQHSNCLSEANLSLFKNATLEDRWHFSFIMGAQLYLCNRAGIFESIRETYFQNKSRPCIYPWHALVVDSYGRVVLCCNDYHSSVVLGDLNQQNILEIWKSKKFSKIRKELIRGNRDIFEICKKCDV